ncbi:MAG: CpsD/CapB family tyrosine-protein kinase [Pseudomonadota bacterium]
MDHIRAAVTKARDTRARTTSPAGLKPGQVDRRVQRADVDFQSFQKTACNFELFAPNRIIANEHDPVLNAYRVLRTRVLQKMEAEGWRTIAVVSPSPSAGKTVTAINLAIAVSSSAASRVTLADFDFYRPSISRYLGLNDPGSILDFFEGQAPLDTLVRRTDLANLMILANERVSRRGSEFLSSTAVTAMFDRAVQSYNSRIVVMDTSPILGCDDTIALLPQVDCVLLVAASGQTRADELTEAKRLLRNTNVVGTILNKAPSVSAGSSYYYY